DREYEPAARSQEGSGRRKYGSQITEIAEHVSGRNQIETLFASPDVRGQFFANQLIVTTPGARPLEHSRGQVYAHETPREWAKPITTQARSTTEVQHIQGHCARIEHSGGTLED